MSEHKCPVGREIELLQDSHCDWWSHVDEGSICHADSRCDRRRYPWKDYRELQYARQYHDGHNWVPCRRWPHQVTERRQRKWRRANPMDRRSYVPAFHSGEEPFDRRAKPTEASPPMQEPTGVTRLHGNPPCPGCGRHLNYPYESGHWRTKEFKDGPGWGFRYQHEHQDQWVDCPGPENKPAPASPSPARIAEIRARWSGYTPRPFYTEAREIYDLLSAYDAQYERLFETQVERNQARARADALAAEIIQAQADAGRLLRQRDRENARLREAWKKCPNCDSLLGPPSEAATGPKTYGHVCVRCGAIEHASQPKEQP